MSRTNRYRSSRAMSLIGLAWVVLQGLSGCNGQVTPPRVDCGLIADGASETRNCYDSATVPNGSSCTYTTQTRTCNNGVWSPDYAECSYLACTVGAHQWDVTVAQPILADPVTITLPGNGERLGTITTSDPPCSGPAYKVDDLDNDTDYIIRTTEVLTAPVMIHGGRNVLIIGIHIDLATAACGSNGRFGNVPGMFALRVSQAGTTFVEGAYIDVAGRAADCIVARNFIGNTYDQLNNGYSEDGARGARDVVIQNSVCRGMSGYPPVHGDILQTQGGYELFRNITFENVSTDSNCEGTVLEPRAGFFLANQIVMRRFDYRMDERYTPELDGGPVQHSAKAYYYDQVFIQEISPEPPYEWTPTSVTTRPCCVAPGLPSCNSGVFCLSPPVDRFASPGTGPATSAWTGLNYVPP